MRVPLRWPNLDSPKNQRVFVVLHRRQRPIFLDIALIGRQLIHKAASVHMRAPIIPSPNAYVVERYERRAIQPNILGVILYNNQL